MDTECSSASQAEPRNSTLSSEKIPWRRVLIGAHVGQMGDFSDRPLGLPPPLWLGNHLLAQMTPSTSTTKTAPVTVA